MGKKEQILNALTGFVVRVAEKEDATPAELEALTGAAGLVLGYCSDNEWNTSYERETHESIGWGEAFKMMQARE